VIQFLAIIICCRKYAIVKSYCQAFVYRNRNEDALFHDVSRFGGLPDGAENGGTITLAARLAPLAHTICRASREWSLEVTPRCFEVRASREDAKGAKGKSHDRLLRVILSSPHSSHRRAFA
jgi:hypothetical protein